MGDEDKASLAELHRACMEKAADFQQETTSRGEELKALASAKKIVADAMSATSELQVGRSRDDTQDDDDDASSSFLQVKARTSSGSASLRAARMVHKLAVSDGSRALTRLASRIDSAVQTLDNPFGKVKGMIS